MDVRQLLLPALSQTSLGTRGRSIKTGSCCREGKHRENRDEHCSNMCPNTFCTDLSPTTKRAQAADCILNYGSGLGGKPLYHLFLVSSPSFLSHIMKTRQPYLTTSTLVPLHIALLESGCLIKSGHPIKFEFQRTKD